MEEGSTIRLAPPAAGDTGIFIASAGAHILSDYYFLPIFQKIPAVALSQDPAGTSAATSPGFIYRITDRDGSDGVAVS
jgi:hypothetical protein